ncbi:MAG: excinuclease ABC subunit B [Paracoccaceae bacterium]
MRLSVLLSLLAAPAFAWDYSASPICTLSHATEKAELTLTYNNRADASYAIEITRKDQAWPNAPIFMMRFDGLRPSVITTDRHVLDGEGQTLKVTDRGFGNVLDGLELNFIATAKSGETMLIFPLTGAAPAVRRFRACVASPEI